MLQIIGGILSLVPHALAPHPPASQISGEMHKCMLGDRDAPTDNNTFRGHHDLDEERKELLCSMLAYGRDKDREMVLRWVAAAHAQGLRQTTLLHKVCSESRTAEDMLSGSSGSVFY